MCRALVFAFRDALETYVAGTNDNLVSKNFSYAAAARSVTRDVAFDLPCALFLTTYALLVLFWAEIYRQARPGARILNPRRVFFFGNLALYVVLAALWAAGGVAAGRANFMTDSSSSNSRTRRTLEACAAGALALCACVLAALFAKYGGSLFFTLRRFPDNLKGRRKKLREVGTVTAVCSLCFSARAAVAVLQTVALGRRGGRGGFLDAAYPRSSPAADVAYYAACELLPAATALVVLRKLPPKKTPRAESARHRGDENV